MQPPEPLRKTLIVESTGIKAERTLAYRLFAVGGRYVWRCCNPPLLELDSPVFDSVGEAMAFARLQGWTVQSDQEPTTGS